MPPALTVAADAPYRVGTQVLALKGAIMVVAVVLQSLRYEKVRISFFPPIFFLAGASVGLCGYKAAIFAFVGIWAVNTGLSNALGFMSAYTLLLLVFGGLFAGYANPRVFLAGLLALLPVLMSLMANRPLMIFTRRGSRG
jgi:hypothetical protein